MRQGGCPGHGAAKEEAEQHTTTFVPYLAWGPACVPKELGTALASGGGVRKPNERPRSSSSVRSVEPKARRTSVPCWPSEAVCIEADSHRAASKATAMMHDLSYFVRDSIDVGRNEVREPGSRRLLCERSG